MWGSGTQGRVGKEVTLSLAGASMRCHPQNLKCLSLKLVYELVYGQAVLAI